MGWFMVKIFRVRVSLERKVRGAWCGGDAVVEMVWRKCQWSDGTGRFRGDIEDKKV